MRPDNSIKNHFYSTLRKQFRKKFGADATRDELKMHDEELAASILHTLTADEHLSSEDTASDLDLAVFGCRIPLPPPGRCFEDEWNYEYPSEYYVMPFSPFDEGCL